MHGQKLMLTPDPPHRFAPSAFSPVACPPWLVSSAPMGIAAGGWITGPARRKRIGDERIVTSRCEAEIRGLGQ
jgi:hypothetical protein